MRRRLPDAVMRRSASPRTAPRRRQSSDDQIIREKPHTRERRISAPVGPGMQAAGLRCPLRLPPPTRKPARFPVRGFPGRSGRPNTEVYSAILVIVVIIAILVIVVIIAILVIVVIIAILVIARSKTRTRVST